MLVCPIKQAGLCEFAARMANLKATSVMAFNQILKK
jgi:hypothetical protein